MKVNQVKIDKIRPYERNAKKHPEKQVKKIADSIDEFGFNQPIVVDKDGVIIVGHGRYFASIMLGLEEVPVIELNIDEKRAKAYRLADNKLNESDWDMSLVIEELKEIEEEDLIEKTGFSNDLLLEPEDKDDVVPEEVQPKSIVGDYYELPGGHRVLCGDSTSEEDVARLMGDVKADMVFTDPPYNVNYKGQGKNTSNIILSDNVEDDDFELFLIKVFKNFADHTKDGAGNYVFHASRTQIAFENALKENGYEIKNQLIWNKPVAVLGWGDYMWKHEPFFYAGKKDKSIQFYGDRTHKTVIDFQEDEQSIIEWAKKQKRLEKSGKSTIWSMKRDAVNGYVHPTQKPVELICYALTNSTKTGDVVMDLFLGSGSTLIASDKLGRVCYGMELDPKYVDVIIQRYVDYTGNTNIKKNGEDIVWAMSKNDDQEEG